MPPKDKTPEQYQLEIAGLQKTNEILATASRRDKLALEILVVAGHVHQDRVDQARAIVEDL